MVIFKQLGQFYCTPLSNFKIRIQNANQIHRLDDFDNAEQITSYLIAFCGFERDSIFIDNSCYDLT